MFRTRTLAEWRDDLEGTNTCFAPVLTMGDAPTHPHHVDRGTFVEVDGVVQPAPAPRFSRTPAPTPGPPVQAGQQTADVLADWGFGADEVERLRDSGAVAGR